MCDVHPSVCLTGSVGRIDLMFTLDVRYDVTSDSTFVTDGLMLE